MPTTLRERHYLPGLRSESEQPVHTCSHGFWYQQQSDDNLSWMGVNDCGDPDVDEMKKGTKPSEPLAFRAGGLTLALPPIPGSAEWVDRRFRECAPNGLPRSSPTFGDWSSPNFWNAPNFTGANCSPSIFAPAPQCPKLPPFETDASYQIDEPSTATSESFFPIPEEDGKVFQLGKPLLHSRTASNYSADDVKPAEAPIPKNKRGRPRLVRDETLNSPAPGHRVPHNQVEQKYRNGLNAELERLREAVSTQMHHNTVSAVKLSKAMVLSGAIDCIKIMEAARDELENENKGLKRCNKRLRREKKMAADE